MLLIKFLLSRLKVRKTTRRGVELCFWKLLLLRSRELFSGSESEVVQSLSEFRVFAADKCKEQKKKEHRQLYRFLP